MPDTFEIISQKLFEQTATLEKDIKLLETHLDELRTEMKTKIEEAKNNEIIRTLKSLDKRLSVIEESISEKDLPEEG